LLLSGYVLYKIENIKISSINDILSYLPYLVLEIGSRPFVLEIVIDNIIRKILRFKDPKFIFYLFFKWLSIYLTRLSLISLCLFFYLLLPCNNIIDLCFIASILYLTLFKVILLDIILFDMCVNSNLIYIDNLLDKIGEWINSILQYVYFKGRPLNIIRRSFPTPKTMAPIITRSPNII